MTYSLQATHPAARGLLLALACLLPAFTGCHSLPTQPPMDFSGPDWVVRQGQAVWKPDAKAAGVAGELLVASNPDGRRVVQFTKTPLPFLVAQRTTNGWQMQIIPKNKTLSGRGEPPLRLIWLHLPDGLERRHDNSKFNHASKPDGTFSFWNVATDESLEGFLSVTTRPTSYVVKTGDNLSMIAAQQGVPLKALREANPEIRGGLIRVGQRLVIPPP